MNILHVISSMHPNAGGTSQAIRNIVPSLNKLGVNNEVVSLDDPNIDFANYDNFKIYKLGKGKTSYQYSYKLLVWLKNNVFEYDVVVVHGIWQYHNFALYQALKNNKNKKIKTPKVIIMPHGMLDPYFQNAPDRKWKALRNEVVWKVTEQKAINAADAIFFTCGEELQLAKYTFKGYRPQREINVGFGIEPPPALTTEMLFQFKQLMPEVNKYWLFLSRIDPKKGVELLIEAYNELCLHNKEVPCLVIAGPTDSDYAIKMKEKAKLNPKIYFPGMLKGDVKWGAFYGCELYILPSFQENFGIAIVEAMSCEKPVLISKNINIWKEIEAGNCGRTLERLDSHILMEELDSFSKMTNEKMYLLGKNAYSTFENNFNIHNQAHILFKELQKFKG
jgi:glycosyltransferase involved in cell wall biosynthesis